MTFSKSINNQNNIRGSKQKSPNGKQQIMYRWGNCNYLESQYIHCKNRKNIKLAQKFHDCLYFNYSENKNSKNQSAHQSNDYARKKWIALRYKWTQITNMSYKENYRTCNENFLALLFKYISEIQDNIPQHSKYQTQKNMNRKNAATALNTS